MLMMYMPKKNARCFLLKTLFFLLAVLTCNRSFAQQQNKIDSLKLVINASSGIKKYDALVSLLRLHGIVNENLEALTCANQAREIALQLSDTARIVQSNRIVGQLFNRLTMYKEAEEILLKILPIAKRHNLTEDYAKVLNNLAILYIYQQAKYDKALRLAFESLQIYEETNDYENKAFIIQNIGVIYYKLKNYHKGLEYFKRSILLRRKIRITQDIDIALVNISLCYINMGDFEKAKLYVDSAFAFCKIHLCHRRTIVDGYFSLGQSHLGLGELDTAEGYFLQSYALAIELNDVRFQLDNLELLSQIYLQQNRLDKAVYYLNRAEQAIGNNSSFDQESIKIYSLFSELYYKTKDYKKVAFYQQKYIDLKDSVYNEDLTTNLIKLEVEYQERENKARLASQEQMLAIKEEEIQSQKLLNVSVVGVVLVFLIVTITLIKSNRQAQEINKILDEKVREQTTALQQSYDALLRASKEKEILLQRTSSDIRNSIATLSGLCAVGLQDITDPDAKEYISKINFSSRGIARVLKKFKPINL